MPKSHSALISLLHSPQLSAYCYGEVRREWGAVPDTEQCLLQTGRCDYLGYRRGPSRGEKAAQAAAESEAAPPGS